MAFGMHIYFNMDVKRSIGILGMQPTILDALHNCLKPKNLSIMFHDFPLYFSEFPLYISDMWGS